MCRKIEIFLDKLITKIAIFINFTCWFVKYITAFVMIALQRSWNFTVIVINLHLFYVSFAGLGLGLGTAGLKYKTAAM